jgi:PAS domain S-box-containing protein
MENFLPGIDKSFAARDAQDRSEVAPYPSPHELAQPTFQLAGVLSTGGTLLECNRAALEDGGLTRDEVIGKPFWETFWWAHTPKTQEDLREAILRAGRGECIRYAAEVCATRSGKEVVLMDFVLRPVKDESGHTLSLMFDGRGIHRGNRTLVNVRGTELSAGDPRDRYRQKLARITLDSMVQFVGLLDAEGTVLEINQVALDGVGIKLSDVEGKPFWTTFWWQVSAEINATLREAISRASRGEFIRWDAEIYGRAGGKETIIIDASLMPVKDEQGNVVFITAEGRDITEKKAHEREIARQREELAKLDELKTQFFANISHEFRTPLTLMIGPLEDAMAQSEGLPASMREQLELAHRNSLRLLKLVNTLLDFSRIEAGRIQASYEPTELAVLTAELASVFRSAIERAEMKLVIDCAPLSEPVYVDREMWEKIVLNLISNAFKFTFKGEIDVSLRETGDAVVLTVRDTGIGIPVEEIPRLFDRFHRVKGARGRSYEGSGIGLALVQELVKLHGGHVRVESEVDHGSRFIVSIPRGKAHLPADRIDADRALTSTALRSDAYVEEVLRWLPDGPPAGRIAEGLADRQPEDVRGESIPKAAGAKAQRILLADDNADMRNYVRRLLVQCGYEVEAVADGSAALGAARARRPDLILTDVMMPELDGFGLLHELRADPALGMVPVILLSARAGEETRIEGMHAGADDYLIKPFSARELLVRVESHLNMVRLRYEAAEALRLRTAQFETLLNHAPMGVYVVDADFRIREVNPVAMPAFGDIPGGIAGRDFDDVIQTLWEKECADEIASIFRHTMKTGESHIAPEWSGYRVDRRVTEYYEWRLDRIVLPDGRFGVVCYFRDIHDRRRAEQNANLLASIVESSEDAIVSKDLDGYIMSWNGGAERLFGYTADEVVGRSIAIIIPPDRLEEEPKILERLKRGERVEHFETIRMRKDGSLLNVSLTISPVKAADGRIVGASKVARDITERVRQEAALQEANAALKRANADLQQFAYSASHDLQEPLRMVAIYSELLQKRFAGKLGPTGDAYIGYTHLGATRMENMLKDLRDYAQVSTVGQNPTEDIDAGEILKKVLSNLDLAIKDSGASISYTPLPRVRMYPFQLEQVFQNLVGNAIRYRSGVAPQIRIAAEPRGKEWLFSIQDNGIGIDPQFKDQIFGIFKRLHSAAECSGTGMGLAICQRAIERAGGRIWVESAPGEGSTFFFTVPCS